jgi:hypothetical protein
MNEEQITQKEEGEAKKFTQIDFVKILLPAITADIFTAISGI